MLHSHFLPALNEKINHYRIAENVYSLRLIEREKNLDGEENLKKVCSQFEAIFLSYLFRQMKKTIPESGFLKEEFSSKIYEEEFYDTIAEKVAEAGGLGLAKILFNQLKNRIKGKSGGENGGNK
ncbi:rod-binding protein [Candidatus Aerophobetes bacterium]|nr:rod-binding protein [Candidatus Aerophobetes bacterium]